MNQHHTIKCLNCDIQLPRRNRSFCSRRCYLSFTQTKISKLCLHCGKSFYVHLSTIKKGYGKFCSASCRTTYRNIHCNPAKQLEAKLKMSNWQKQGWEKRYGKEKADRMRKKQSEITKEAHRTKRILPKKGTTFELLYGIEKAQLIKEKMSRASSGVNNPMYGKIVYPKPYFSSELGHSVRSSWEEEVCILLKKWHINYTYEPMSFTVEINGKKHTYTPDIMINNNFFIEVKGPLFTLQLLKMKAFIEQHKKKLIVIGADRYKLDSEEIIHVPYEERERLEGFIHA